MHTQNFHILVVDDDEDDRFLINDALYECDMVSEVELEFAEDGEEAIAYLTQGHGLAQEQRIDLTKLPDLILLDWNMPRMNGREVLEVLGSSRVLRALPVVVLTTSSQQADVRQTYELGGRSFITKPTSFEGLVRIMKQIRAYWDGTVTLPGIS